MDSNVCACVFRVCVLLIHGLNMIERNVCLCVNVSESLWKSFKVCGSLWKSLKICESLWKCDVARSSVGVRVFVLANFGCPVPLFGGTHFLKSDPNVWVCVYVFSIRKKIWRLRNDESSIGKCLRITESMTVWSLHEFELSWREVDHFVSFTKCTLLSRYVFYGRVSKVSNSSQSKRSTNCKRNDGRAWCGEVFERWIISSECPRFFPILRVISIGAQFFEGVRKKRLLDFLRSEPAFCLYDDQHQQHQHQ